MKLPKGYKADLWEFQQAVKKMRALQPFEAYERQFVQDHLKASINPITPQDVYNLIANNLDLGGGGDATSHGRDILESAVQYVGPKPKTTRRRSTVRYFMNGGY